MEPTEETILAVAEIVRDSAAMNDAAFAGRRVEALGRLAATPGTGPEGKGGGYSPPSAEEQARYDAFIASYVPPKRSRKRSR